MELTLTILLSIGLLLLGVITLRANIKSDTNRYFSAFTLFTAFWALSNYFSNVSKNYDIALWSNRLIFTSTSLLIWVLFLFSSVYPNVKAKLSKWAFYLGSLITVIIVISSLTTAIVESTETYSDHSDVTFGILFPVYGIHFGLFFLLFFYNLITKYIKSKGLERVKIQYLAIGISISAIGAMITNLLLPAIFNRFEFTSLGPFFLLFFIGFSSTAIVRHRLFGLNYILGTTFKTLSTGAFAYIVFYIVYFLEIYLWKSVLSTESLVLGMLIAMLFVFIFNILNKKISLLVDKYLSFVKVDIAVIKEKFIDTVASELQVEVIANQMINVVKRAVELESCCVILFDNEEKKIVHQFFDSALEFSQEDITSLFSNVKISIDNDVIVTEELYYKIIEGSNQAESINISRFLNKYNLSALVPNNLKGKISGITFMGRKETQKALTSQEISFIKSIAQNASIALSRAILHERVENFNAELKREIDEATAELRSQKQELQEKYQQEKDMIGILGHELRTPLTVAKNMNELLKSKVEIMRNEKLIDYDYILSKINKIADSLTRETNIIETALSTSRIDNNKIEVLNDKIDIVEMIEFAIDAHEQIAEQKGLSLSFAKPEFKVPVFVSDSAKVQEIITNLISNAVKYTFKGFVKAKLDINEEYIYFSVEDSGEGIPKELLSKLGQKFYRVNQHLDEKNSVVRPGGTGLGLYVVKSYVKLLGGELEIKSEVGKGSTFTISLPLREANYTQMEVAPKEENQDEVDMFAQLGLKKDNLFKIKTI